MNWSVIPIFIAQSVPLGVVAIIVFQALMARDIKSLTKQLDNHVEDTNKKIENLNSEMKEVKITLAEIKSVLNK